MVDNTICKNCESLKFECAKLKLEVQNLHEKFDNLAKTVANNKQNISTQDFSCQTEFITPLNYLATPSVPQEQHLSNESIGPAFSKPNVNNDNNS